MENRAAVFTSQPQDVEVYRDGAWWPGSLLGWRHDADGGCQVRVRLAAGGAEETAWTALDYLRLPEAAPVAPAVRHISVVDAPAGRAPGDSALTATMAAIRAVPSPAAPGGGRDSAPSELTATMNLFAVRDLDAEARTVAPRVAAPAPRSGGRHRAPAAGSGASGRHRAADTGVRAAVRPDDPPEMPPSAVQPGRADDAEVDLFTRPMRLDDLPGRVPQPRRAQLEGRLAGR
jgi:hypothetical protein